MDERYGFHARFFAAAGTKSMIFVPQPAEEGRLGDFLKEQLRGDWSSFRAAVAFVKRSGTRHIVEELKAFSADRPAEMIVGIDHFGTSLEGMTDLLEAVTPSGRIFVLHNRLPYTFHPKVYLFSNSVAATAIVGSGNLTEGGLFTNYEASLRLDLDLSNHSDKQIFEKITATLDQWSDTSSGIIHLLSDKLLGQLAALGLVPPEALVNTFGKTAGHGGSSSTAAKTDHDDEESQAEESPFGAVPVPKAPNALRPSTSASGRAEEKPTRVRGTETEKGSEASGRTGFVMTLQNTDVGVGQTSAGVSRRSPEVFIPLGARDADPEFWGWPDQFTEDKKWTGKVDSAGRGKMDRVGVKMNLSGRIITVNMFFNPNKGDLRLRSEDLRSAGSVGDILRLEKVDGHGFEYYAEIVPPGTTQYPVYNAKCDISVRSPSKKRYGYY